MNLLYNNIFGRNAPSKRTGNFDNQLDNAGGLRPTSSLPFRKAARPEQHDRAADCFAQARTDAVWQDDVLPRLSGDTRADARWNGFKDWTAQMGDGLQLLTIVERFVGSQEFQNRYADVTTSEGFVTLFYNNILVVRPTRAAWPTGSTVSTTLASRGPRSS